MSSSSSPSIDTDADRNPHDVVGDAAAAAEQDAEVARLQQTIALVLSDDNDSRLEGTVGIFELLSAEGGSGLFHQVEQSGVVGRLVEFLEIDDSPNLQVVEALGEIAHGDSPDCGEILLSSGAFEALLPHLSEDAESSMAKLAIRALSKFWTAKPTPSLYQTERVLLVIGHLIGSSDDELKSEACWALCYVTRKSKENIERVISMRICPRLVQLLGHPNLNVIYAALHAVNMMSYGDEFHIQCMINNNGLPRLVNLLTNDHVMRIKDDSCRAIWHIAFRSKMLKEAVVASGAISALINLLQNPEFDAKKKAAWAFRNVTYEASKDQIKFLVDEGCVRTLCNPLDSRDQETLKVCMQGLESILKAGECEKNLESSGDDNVYAHKFKEAEGVRMMRKLLNDDGDEIHQMAARILERYCFKKKRMMSSVD